MMYHSLICLRDNHLQTDDPKTAEFGFPQQPVYIAKAASKLGQQEGSY